MATAQSDKDVFDKDAIVKSAKALLALLPTTDVDFIETGPGETHGLPGAVTGSFRIGGQALIVPVPESASMIAAFPKTIEFYKEAPRVVKALVEALEAEK